MGHRDTNKQQLYLAWQVIHGHQDANKQELFSCTAQLQIGCAFTCSPGCICSVYLLVVNITHHEGADRLHLVDRVGQAHPQVSAIKNHHEPFEAIVSH